MGQGTLQLVGAKSSGSARRRAGASGGAQVVASLGRIQTPASRRTVQESVVSRRKSAAFLVALMSIQNGHTFTQNQAIHAPAAIDFFFPHCHSNFTSHIIVRLTMV